jgi:hypothetical protein
VWFQEGVAQFYAYAGSGGGFWKENRLEEIRRTMKGFPWLGMKEIESAIAKKDVAPLHIYVSYLESEALVLKIAKDRGESWIPSMLNRLRQGAPFETAYQEVVGVTPEISIEHLHHAWE